MVRTSLDISESLWDRVRHRAINEKVKLKDVLERALEAYLKTPVQKSPDKEKKAKVKR